jgi:hypothetical protein
MLAERWNGKRWSIQPTPTINGGTPDITLVPGLEAVSCVSRAACLAVGFYATAGGTPSTLAERWNGRRWSIEQAARVGGVLLGVSCASKTACTAVGFTFPGLSTLAERWNGKRWAIQAPVLPYASRTRPLGAVSCASATACLAVSGAVFNPDCLNAVCEWRAASWNRNKWSVVQPPRAWVFGQGGGVACPSPSECIVLGNDGSLSVGRWNGVTWSIQPIRGAPSLEGVSCPSSTVCTAVGRYEAGVPPELAPACAPFTSPCGDMTLAERWNGRRWSIQATPRPPGATSSGLGAVSCATTTACIAVGSYRDAGGQQRVLAERWNGTG